jgi:nucleoside recognition membrane protein YjiH
MIFREKQLQIHPNKLIALICLCDSFTFAQFVIRYFLCGFQLFIWISWMFAYSAQYPGIWLSCQFSSDSLCWEKETTYLALHGMFPNTQAQMLAAWYFSSLTVSYFSLFLMASTIYDLALILKNPF